MLQAPAEQAGVPLLLLHALAQVPQWLVLPTSDVSQPSLAFVLQSP
jgi:hypothetical protein